MIKTCVVCGKKFEAYDKKHHHGSQSKFKRRSNAKTCSKKCARDYSLLRQRPSWKPFVQEDEDDS